MKSAGPLDLKDVAAAADRIRFFAVEAPLKESVALSALVNRPVLLKLETMQPSGSFKVRGAANKLLSLRPSDRGRGAITASTGYHGRAVAYVTRRLGISCTVCLSDLVPRNKVAAVRSLGASADIGGETQDEAIERAIRRAAAESLVLVPPFDDEMVVAGQGTIGLELMAAAPNLKPIVVPLSGGGLAAGVALAAKAIRRCAKIIGISSDRCPAMIRSLKATATTLATASSSPRRDASEQAEEIRNGRSAQ